MVELTELLHQNKDLDVDWPDGHPELKAAFDSVDSQTLANAAFVIYRWGYWGHVYSVTATYPGLAPRSFPDRRAADDWVKQLDTYPPVRGEDTVFEYHRAGPDNKATIGAYWKFERLARQVLREREYPYNEDEIGGRLDYDDQAFMDHKPGTSYTNDELPQFFYAPLAGSFRPLRVAFVNHKPHPFVIGQAHMKYASEHGGILGEAACRSAICAHPQCRLDYDEHTSERALFLKPTRNMENAEAAAILTSVKSLLEEHKIDGIVFVSSPFKIAEPAPLDEATTEDSDSV